MFSPVSPADERCLTRTGKKTDYLPERGAESGAHTESDRQALFGVQTPGSGERGGLFAPAARCAAYCGRERERGLRDVALWYAFVQMDDGTYQAELEEMYWEGGGHTGGGTICREIPEEWFSLSFEEFLKHVVRLSAAAHYGFTDRMLQEKTGLREFFGF